MRPGTTHYALGQGQNYVCLSCRLHLAQLATSRSRKIRQITSLRRNASTNARSALPPDSSPSPAHSDLHEKKQNQTSIREGHHVLSPNALRKGSRYPPHSRFQTQSNPQQRTFMSRSILHISQGSDLELLLDQQALKSVPPPLKLGEGSTTACRQGQNPGGVPEQEGPRIFSNGRLAGKSRPSDAPLLSIQRAGSFRPVYTQVIYRKVLSKTERFRYVYADVRRGMASIHPGPPVVSSNLEVTTQPKKDTTKISKHWSNSKLFRKPETKKRLTEETKAEQVGSEEKKEKKPKPKLSAREVALEAHMMKKSVEAEIAQLREKLSRMENTSKVAKKAALARKPASKNEPGLPSSQSVPPKSTQQSSRRPAGKKGSSPSPRHSRSSKQLLEGPESSPGSQQSTVESIHSKFLQIQRKYNSTTSNTGVLTAASSVHLSASSSQAGLWSGKSSFQVSSRFCCA